MTIFQVSPGGLSLTAAAAQVQPGDEVIVAPGTYREQFVIDTPSTVWRSAEPRAAVLDGGYGWRLGTTRGLSAAPSMPSPGPKHLPGGKSAAERGFMVTIKADGVRFVGFVFQNLAGGGVTFAGDGIEIRDCAFYALYGTAIHSNATDGSRPRDCVVSGCDIAWTSLRTFVLGDGEAAGAIKVANAGPGIIIDNCAIQFAGGEGINIGKRNRATVEKPVTVRGCWVFDSNHTALYANQSEHVRFEGCIAGWHENVNPYPKAATKAGAAGLRCKDENSQTQVISSRGIVFAGCVVVNARLLDEQGGDDVTQYDCYRTNNTYVSGPYTWKGLSIIAGSNAQGTECDYTGNAVHWGRHLDGAILADGPRSRCVFADNAWSEQPPASHCGEGDYYGDLALANPDAPLTLEGEVFYPSWAEWDANRPRSSFDLDNYRPLADSALVGPEEGEYVGALAPLVEEPEPGPEPVDWDALIAQAAAIGAQLATTAEQVTALLSKLGEYKTAAESGKEKHHDE